ncbi:monocarboxylate transporter 13-like [Dermacentor andersoni]|uniref:monocarboxylate transporter 13-like n=1 Tax=Dermacentor andersoni TaxID=34620 RepID=UPI003B3B23E0
MAIRGCRFFYVAFMREFGVDRQHASWPTSVYLAMDDVSGIVVACLQKYYCVSTISLIGTALFCVGILTSQFAPNIAWMTVTFGIIQGCGTGIVSVAVTVILMMYFDRYRGVATGIRYAGYSLSSLLYPPILAQLEVQFTLRWKVHVKRIHLPQH